MAKVTELMVKMSADVAELRAGMAAAGQAIGLMAKQVQTLGNQMKAVFTGAVVGGLVNLVKGVLDSVGALQDQSEALGIAASDLQAYQLAAAGAGVSNEKLQGGLSKYLKLVGEASEGNKEAVETLRKFGILKFDTPQRQIQALGQAIEKIEDPTKKVAAAYALMGKTGAALIPAMGDLAKSAETLKTAYGVSADLDRVAEQYDKLETKAQAWITVTKQRLVVEAWTEAEQWLRDNAALVNDLKNRWKELGDTWVRLRGIIDPEKKIFGPANLGRDQIKSTGEELRFTIGVAGELADGASLIGLYFKAWGAALDGDITKLEQIKRLIAEIQAAQAARVEAGPAGVAGATGGSIVGGIRVPPLPPSVLKPPEPFGPTLPPGWQPPKPKEDKGSAFTAVDPKAAQKAADELAKLIAETKRYQEQIDKFAADKTTPYADLAKDIQNAAEMQKRLDEATLKFGAENPITKQILAQIRAAQALKDKLEDVRKATQEADAVNKQYGDGTAEFIARMAELHAAFETGRIKQKAFDEAVKDTIKTFQEQKINFDWGRDASNVLKEVQTSVENLGGSIFDSFFKAEGSIKQFVSTFLMQTGKMVFQMLVWTPIIRAFMELIRGWLAPTPSGVDVSGNPMPATAGVAGGRQGGGHVWPGAAFMVGERGPERFIPSMPGHIEPAQAGTVNISIDARGVVTDAEDPARAGELARRMKAAVMDVLRNERRPGGMMAQGIF